MFFSTTNQTRMCLLRLGEQTRMCAECVWNVCGLCLVEILKQANAYVFGLQITDARVFASKRWEKQYKRVCVWCMDSKRVCVWHLKQKMLQNSILRHSSAQVFVQCCAAVGLPPLVSKKHSCLLHAQNGHARPQPHEAEKKMLARHLLAENKQIKYFTATFLKSKKKRFKNLRKI